MKKIYLVFLILFFCAVGLELHAQTADSTWSEKHTKEWFEKKAWLGGLDLKPHGSINKKEFVRQYQLNKTYWDVAFAYLKEHDLQTLPKGKYPIDGENVFVIITENPTKDYDSTIWESHRNYIDLHYVVSGEEKIGVQNISELTVTKPYDSAKDLINYSGKGKIYKAEPGVFFIFFPADGHRPAITPGGNKADKKIVIKIRYAS